MIDTLTEKEGSEGESKWKGRKEEKSGGENKRG